jgi:phosphoglucosamine mutase
MLFGSSGIRRPFGPELLDIGLKAGFAAGSNVDSIVVGTDTRKTGPALSDAFTAGVLFSGAEVVSGGIAPTPTIANAINYCCAGAGCSVTASHNPENYNGIKLINPDGSAFTKKQQAEIEDNIKSCKNSDWKRQGEVRETDIIRPHIENILKSVDIGDTSVILDCGGGAGSVITPLLLREAGVDARCINCTPSGIFPRPSEPLEENVHYLKKMVKDGSFSGGLIHDGDADRFMAIDGRGRYIKGDHLLVLFAEYAGAKKVVTTADASMAIEESAEVRRTPVGDSYVSEELLSWGDFGGEPSGSWIFPENSLCPDGIYAAALFCRIASETDIAEAVDELPDYPILRSSYFCENGRDILTALGADNPTDGIRIEDEDGWCLIRASGTEPKVRITAEGRTADTAKKMKERGLGLLKSAVKK